MSLTNPDKVITEERLSEFYQGILPYLGGMPEAIANKFSRADLYSETEKIVGCWTDGKPIYQKTISDTLPACSTDGTAIEKNVSIGVSVDKVINSIGYIHNTSSGVDALMPFTATVSPWCVASYFMKNNASASNANCVCISNSKKSWNGLACEITVQYTKTTDSANSFKFSSETDYSTTEHIVGTWIDGKPLYQKTVDFGAMPNNTIKSVAHGISNLKVVVNLVGCDYNSDYSKQQPLPYSNITQNANVCLRVTGSNIEIETGADWRAYTAYVTLQYTKTTD